MEDRLLIKARNSPIIATAIHDGHFIPKEFLDNMSLEEHERSHEEDPYTGFMADLPVNTVIAENSRFLADLNRPRNKCIYKTPDDAWGLTVWKQPLSTQKEQQLLDYYDTFYTKIKQLLENIINQHGCLLVLDIHTYNYRRQNPQEKASKQQNPEINIGTKNNLPHARALIDTFIDFLSQSKIYGHRPDVRENIKFQGGEFSKWIANYYGQYGCVLSIEFKKTFMDEWTGRANIKHLMDIQATLKDSIPLLKKELKKFKSLTAL
ncbi:N-formylglutamate amidohydrolase [Olivibacter domesticus]|uniref:N-formylglutamate amidohydrolase n=1 Tax=Olivibacter domesticus TaxID=407022 RepID=A0A1H7M7J8_OLID1|nr:N-formylglutamate amidohydrolase [Olivibacter domesticus]SEL07174.1 N-formylglutamate amidohydrolase [Olivibacter domesticus]